VEDLPAAGRRLKAAYFNYYLGHAGVAAFLSWYFSGLGLSGRQIGVLLAVGPVIGLLVQPLWSLLADGRTGVRGALVAALAGAGAASWLLPLGQSFPALFALVVGWAVFFNGIDPLLNSLALHTLGSRAEAFGRIRLYGSYGNAVSQLAVGALVHAAPAAAMFGWQGAWLFLSLALIARAGPRRETAGAGPGSGGRLSWNRLRQLWTRRPLWIFLVAALLSQTSQVMGWSYFAVYARSAGAGSVEAGAGLWIAVVSAFPFFLLGERLLRRFGPRRLLVASSAAYALRWGLLSITPPMPAVFAIQLLNGLGYGLYYVSAVALVYRETPAGFKATGQGVLSAVHVSLATICGGLLGGVLLEALGVAWVYRAAAVLALLSLIPVLAMRPGTGQEEQETAQGRFPPS